MKYVSGRYQGKKLCAMTMAEYREMYDNGSLDNSYAQVIIDKDNCLVDEGYIVGKFSIGSIELFADKSRKLINKPVVISERSTIDALVNEDRVAKLANEGEQKLNILITEGVTKTTAATRKRKRPVRKIENEN